MLFRSEGVCFLAVSEKAVFSFLYLKKIKILKIYVGFGKFQKYTPVALWGRQGSNVIFFSSNLQQSPWRKKKEGGLSPPNGEQAPVAHPRGDRVPSSCWPSFPLSFEPKNSGKKIGVRRSKAAKLCRIAYS